MTCTDRRLRPNPKRYRGRPEFIFSRDGYMFSRIWIKRVKGDCEPGWYQGNIMPPSREPKP